MTHISYDKGDYGYQINIYPPSDKYPMYQVACNDDDFSSLRAFSTQDDVKIYVDFILRHADAWEAAS